jgi:hypothetical protein
MAFNNHIHHSTEGIRTSIPTLRRETNLRTRREEGRTCTVTTTIVVMMVVRRTRGEGEEVLKVLTGVATRMGATTTKVKTSRGCWGGSRRSLSTCERCCCRSASA